MIINYLIKQSKKPSGFVGKIMMRLWNKTYMPMVKWSLKFVKTDSIHEILDVGVGNGQSSVYLSKMLPQARVLGIDISEAAIREARKLGNGAKLSFTVSNIEQTAFESAKFDLVCAFQTHFHWGDFAKALTEIHRLLNDQGQLLLACEKGKVSYFLPELETDKNFKTFIELLGFQLRAVRRQKAWVAYYCQKRPQFSA